MAQLAPVAEAIQPTGKGAGVTEGAQVLDWGDVERRLTSGGGGGWHRCARTVRRT